MKFTTAAAAAALLSTASSALVARNYTVGFDENGENNGFYGVNITGSYNKLHYTNWQNGPYDFMAGMCSYICPRSFPVEAEFKTGNDQPLATISTSYKGSTVQYYKMKDTWFGCNANLSTTYEGEPSPYQLPVNCTMTVKGYTDKNKPAVAQQTFRYVPALGRNSNTGAPNAQMQNYVFNKNFQTNGIKYTTWSATASKTVDYEGYHYNINALFVYMDDFSYVTYSTT